MVFSISNLIQLIDGFDMYLVFSGTMSGLKILKCVHLDTADQNDDHGITMKILWWISHG